ncbi:ROK family protein [Collinsella sp. AGMB00827]|uniref:ROK family protein n=1 Tax=Collinsella ureilytica TaxID=2869515 RepID=A0ABS7MK49_9ACTN|nr:ROK family protein [Collinsella urealyticum]MBY4797657.1 ROK family protein [Collinsella urealyticum]
MKRLFGIDLGGTTVKFSIVDEAGRILDRWAIPTDVSDGGANIPGDIVEHLRAKMSELPEDEVPVAVGIGVPGPIMGDVVERAVNLGWNGMPLGRVVKAELGLPVSLLNDANAAALGEVWMGGDAEGMGGNAVFVTLGTGVGGGIIVGGRIMNGDHGCAGEIGHSPVDASGVRQCGCGKTNCLECYASASGFVKTANQLLARAGSAHAYASGKEVFDDVAAGDPLAIDARDITVEYLAKNLAAIVNTVDPREIIIGGGLSYAGDLLMGPLSERLGKYVFPGIRDRYVLRRAMLGNDAGLLGAAYQALLDLDA